jgi:hypothetical protein
MTRAIETLKIPSWKANVTEEAADDEVPVADVWVVVEPPVVVVFEVPVEVPVEEVPKVVAGAYRGQGDQRTRDKGERKGGYEHQRTRPSSCKSCNSRSRG